MVRHPDIVDARLFCGACERGDLVGRDGNAELGQMDTDAHPARLTLSGAAPAPTGAGGHGGDAGRDPRRYGYSPPSVTSMTSTSS